MTGVGDDSRGRLPGRPWFVVGLALAVAATLALVLAEDIRYLRLGIVAALWAALVGAFLAVRYRKQATGTEDAVAQAQEVYELELEREIAARREYELELENDLRAKAQADSREELDALRAEVSALRESLQSLFGGEVLLERFALTAQATRMRSSREEQKIVEAAGNGYTPPQLTAGSDAVRQNGSTDRVREKPPARPAGRRAAPEPRRPDRSLDLPHRRVAKGEPGRGGTEAERTRVQKAPHANGFGDPHGFPPDFTRPAFDPLERRRRQTARTQVDDSSQEPTKFAKPVDADATAAWSEPLLKPAETTAEEPPARSRNTPPAQPAAQAQPVPAENPRPRTRPVRPPQAPSSSPQSPQPQWSAEVSRPRVPPVPQPQEPRFEQPEPVQEPAARSAPVHAEEIPMSNNPTLPEEVRRLAKEGPPGGRRRRPDDEETPAEQQAATGRRHRAEGEPPSWETPAREQQATGSHAKPEPETEGGHRAAESGGRRAKPDDEATGSHSAGRSVSDLLAAQGMTDAIPRRRRRAED